MKDGGDGRNMVRGARCYCEGGVVWTCEGGCEDLLIALATFVSCDLDVNFLWLVNERERSGGRKVCLEDLVRFMEP